MWYFTWVLGLGLAVSLGILNGLWHEFQGMDRPEPETRRKPTDKN
jgi:cyd operon protein YbgT